jgi:transcriptional regulator with XRE-family HTH domain
MGFHLRLKRLREAAGLTQGELAERAGMSKGGVANLEQGIRRPEWDTVQALAKALGVDCRAFQDDAAIGDANEEAPKTLRGRPPKSVSDEPPQPKRPRGRPRKDGAK